MATNRAAALLRERGDPERATFLELFFDLVFVFALTRVSQRLVSDLTSERSISFAEAGETLLLLLALWMVWFATALITDLYDPQRPEIQLLVVLTMFGSMVMAVAVPGAFGGRGLLFVAAYLVIHLGRGFYFLVALRGHVAWRRAARVLFWFVVSAAPWLVGALVAQDAIRGSLWALALIIDYGAALFNWPVPRLRRRSTTELPIVAEHLSERFRQFFIVALGELILITGITYSGTDFAAEKTVGFVASFGTTVLIWRTYIYRAGELLPAAIAAAPDPGRLVRLTSISHLLMVAGIVAIAAGEALVVEHPVETTDPTWIPVLIGGPTVFLAGRALFEYAVFSYVSPARWIALAVLVLAAPVMVMVPPLAVTIVAAVMLAGVAVADALRARRRRRPVMRSPAGSTPTGTR